MTDKERLERVEEIVNIITTTESEEEYNSAVNAFILSHMTWTLERIQELESENRALKAVATSNKNTGEQYLQENKRFREALEFYAEQDNYEWETSYRPQQEIDCMVIDDGGHTARKALEGEE